MLIPRICCCILLLVATARRCESVRCDRTIDGSTRLPTPAEGKFHFYMTFFNQTDPLTAYMPNTKYIVYLWTDTLGQMPRKFTRFLISADSDEDNPNGDTGVFDILDESMTKFSGRCPNAVVETSNIPKEDVSVGWTSPAEGSGCVNLRATVMESPDTWYIGDPELTLKLCQDSKAEADEQGPVLAKCNACDEAKYEVTFEGLWSRNTHPKDFPSKGWLTRFSDVIGASHTVNYSFWEYDGMASEGLQQVAEVGSTRRLESELKNQSEHIRTIIKARGITYPNVTGRTFAVFRVDRKHHLMSLVSMIDPSPDWIVGVSGLELCLPNGSWTEHKELNLYPYDAGTDDGITYVSADSPSEPHEPIRRITPSYPNDSRSPFYDPTGADMKPMARLYLNRQRLYEKACEDPPEEASDKGAKRGRKKPPKSPKSPRNKACKTTQWGPWSGCSVTCGRGRKLRQRQYVDKKAADANKCNAPLTDRMTCYGDAPRCDNGERRNGILGKEMCSLDEWSPWSQCTTSCGPGLRTRTRNFRHRKHRKECMAAPDRPNLQETTDCDRNLPCPDGEEDGEVSENDQVTDEEGGEDEDGQDEDQNGEDEDQEGQEEDQNGEDEDQEGQDEDQEGQEEGQDGEEGLDGQESQDDQASADPEPFESYEGYDNDEPDMPVEVTEEWMQRCPDHLYTQWSNWSPCSVTCGSGLTMRVRFANDDWLTGRQDAPEILEDCKQQETFCSAPIKDCNISKEEAERICSEPKVEGHCNGKHLRWYMNQQLGRCKSFTYSGCDANRNNFRTEEDCKKTCIESQSDSEFKGIESGSQVAESTEGDGSRRNCRVSEWSKWSHCEGCRGFTNRTRKILVPPRNGGKKCPMKLMQRRRCHKVPPCSLEGDGTGRRSYRDRNSVADSDEISVNCRVSQWSAWSRCSASCGKAVQHRTRKVEVKPRGPWARLCPALAEFRECVASSCP